LEPIDLRLDTRHQADALGIYEQAKGSNHRNPPLVRHFPRQTIIEYDNDIVYLPRQYEDFRFTRAQVMVEQQG